MAQGQLETWFFGGNPGGSEEEQIAYLVDRLTNLERILGAWQQTMNYGPVPGAYHMVNLRAHAAGGLGTGAADTKFDLIGRPIFVQAFVDQGDLDINIVASSSGDLLTADLNVQGLPKFVGARGDFTVEQVAGIQGVFYELNIRAINSGTPTRLNATLALKNVPSIEP